MIREYPQHVQEIWGRRVKSYASTPSALGPDHEHDLLTCCRQELEHILCFLTETCCLEMLDSVLAVVGSSLDVAEVMSVLRVALHDRMDVGLADLLLRRTGHVASDFSHYTVPLFFGIAIATRPRQPLPLHASTIPVFDWLVDNVACSPSMTPELLHQIFIATVASDNIPLANHIMLTTFHRFMSPAAALSVMVECLLRHNAFALLPLLASFRNFMSSAFPCSPVSLADHADRLIEHFFCYGSSSSCHQPEHMCLLVGGWIVEDVEARRESDPHIWCRILFKPPVIHLRRFVKVMMRDVRVDPVALMDKCEHVLQSPLQDRDDGLHRLRIFMGKPFFTPGDINYSTHPTLARETLLLLSAYTTPTSPHHSLPPPPPPPPPPHHPPSSQATNVAVALRDAVHVSLPASRSILQASINNGIAGAATIVLRARPSLAGDARLMFNALRCEMFSWIQSMMFTHTWSTIQSSERGGNGGGSAIVSASILSASILRLFRQVIANRFMHQPMIKDATRHLVDGYVLARFACLPPFTHLPPEIVEHALSFVMPMAVTAGSELGLGCG
jgi:hypothetical protein